MPIRRLFGRHLAMGTFLGSKFPVSLLQVTNAPAQGPFRCLAGHYSPIIICLVRPWPGRQTPRVPLANVTMGRGVFRFHSPHWTTPQAIRAHSPPPQYDNSYSDSGSRLRGRGFSTTDHRNFTQLQPPPSIHKMDRFLFTGRSAEGSTLVM